MDKPANYRRPGLDEPYGEVKPCGFHAATIRGWHLNVCMFQCACHRNPETGKMDLYEDKIRGLLGLVKHLPFPCDCCEPWGASELAALLRDLAGIQAINTSDQEGVT